MNSLVLQASATEPKPGHTSMYNEVLSGLSSSPKRLASKFFYDARGSELFEQICEQPEYYLTRTELEIMRTHGPAMAWVLGERVRLVEFGSGSGAKTRVLLKNLASPAAYIPVEISESALAQSVAELALDFPMLEVLPVVADFTERLMLPESTLAGRRTVVYFPGSTLGNFDTVEALAILRNIRRTVGTKGGALIGIDLKKDISVLEAAYNDAAGVTSAFTLNMLTHLNREVGTDFDVSLFEHHARYDADNGRIETNLVSQARQTVRLGNRNFEFSRGEAMLVEYSHKYSMMELIKLARRADLQVANYWTDPDERFAVVYLSSLPATEEYPRAA